MKAHTIGTQFHVAGADFDPSNLCFDIRNDDVNKPLGGFWASTFTGHVSLCPFVEYARSDDYDRFMPGRIGNKCYLVHVNPDAKICVIRSAADLKALYKQYTAEVDGAQVLDYVAMAQDFDGVMVTDRAIADRIPDDPTVMTIHQLSVEHWTRESVVFFRECFTLKPYGVRRNY